MFLPDSFHRLKRTVLLFATACLLIALAGASSATLTVPLVQGASVPMKVAYPMIWMATAYYAFGFWLEYKAAERVNTGVFDRGAASLSKALENWAVALQSPDPTVEERNHGPGQLIFAIRRHHDFLANEAGPDPDWPRTFRERLTYQLANELDPPPADRGAAMAIADRLALSVFNAAEWPLPDRAAADQTLLQSLSEHELAVARAHGEILAVQKAVTKLSDRLAGARRFSFTWWETGLTLVYVTVALVVAGNAIAVAHGWILIR